MHYHRRLLLRIVVVLTVKIRASRKWEREPDRAIDPAPLLSWICIGWGPILPALAAGGEILVLVGCR